MNQTRVNREKNLEFGLWFMDFGPLLWTEELSIFLSILGPDLLLKNHPSILGPDLLLKTTPQFIWRKSRSPVGAFFNDQSQGFMINACRAVTLYSQLVASTTKFRLILFILMNKLFSVSEKLGLKLSRVNYQGSSKHTAAQIPYKNIMKIS